MTKTLFSPKKIDIPDSVVLIPHFYDSDCFQKIKKRALRSFFLLGSEVLVLERYALITGFLGYPYLLTLLEFIEGIKEKEIFFLGTAGSLEKNRDRPCSLHITSVAASGIFRFFSTRKTLELKDLSSGEFEKVRAVSVDIVQRETRKWLRTQINRGIQVVEMELFPLRIYLKKSFVALVVISDRVTEEGIKPFSDTKGFKCEFVRTFGYIDYLLDENKIPV